MTDFNATVQWCGYCELCERDLWFGDYTPRDGKEICQECSEELDSENLIDELFENLSETEEVSV